MTSLLLPCAAGGTRPDLAKSSQNVLLVCRWIHIDVFIYFFRLGVCDNAEPAADFEVLLVRPSRSVFEAALAALSLVCFFGVLVWLKALPAAFWDEVPMLFELKVFDALLAAFLLVTFLFVGIFPSLLKIGFVTVIWTTSWFQSLLKSPP